MKLPSAIRGVDGFSDSIEEPFQAFDGVKRKAIMIAR